MTRGRDFKRRVRARMRLTGERYTAARAELTDAPKAAPPLPREPERQTMDQPEAKRADIFRRFDDNAIRATQWSANCARAEGSEAVEPRHQLLGVAAVDGGASDALRAHGDVVSLLRGAREAGEDEERPHVPYSPEAKSVLEQTLIEAIAAEANVIGTEHILAALLDEGGASVKRVLDEQNFDLDALRASLPAPDPQDRAAASERARAFVPPPGGIQDDG